LHGPGRNFVADFVRLDIRIEQISCKRPDEPCRRRTDGAANRPRAARQLDHILRERTREIQHVGSVGPHHVEFARRHHPRPLALLHARDAADLQHHDICIVMVGADQVRGSRHT